MIRVDYRPAEQTKGMSNGWLADVFKTEEEQRNRLLGAQLVLVGNIVNDATFGTGEERSAAISKLESIVMGEMRILGNDVLTEVKQFAMRKLSEMVEMERAGIVI